MLDFVKNYANKDCASSFGQKPDGKVGGGLQRSFKTIRPSQVQNLVLPEGPSSNCAAIFSNTVEEIPSIYCCSKGKQ